MDKNFWSEITHEALRSLSLPALRSLARRANIDNYALMSSTAICEALLVKKATFVKAEAEAKARESALPAGSDAAPSTEEYAEARGVTRERPREEDGRMQDVGDAYGRRIRPMTPRDTFNETSTVGTETREGLLEILPDGYGFIRVESFRNTPRDAYVPAQRIKRSNLRMGDLIRAYVRPNVEGKPGAVVDIISVNGHTNWTGERRPTFENFTPVYPDQRFRLEIPGKRNELATRCIDLIAPIGKGQRAMIVSPPKAGKTTLLKMVANSLTTNHPDVKLLVLLIDERPEEVTDMQRSIKGDIFYSTFDEECDNHIKVAEMVLARAKRLVEEGMDVVILLDSLTRMARANNVVVPSSGKTLSGGVDPVALYFPKRFFGAARNIENGGSLTVIATALVDTGSRMDDIVYEEFKGTGNMEVHLDRRLSEKRIFPAIDLARSGTRKEELLLTQKELEGEYNLRRLLASGDNQEAAEAIISLMSKTITNTEFLQGLELQIAKMRKDGFRI